MMTQQKLWDWLPENNIAPIFLIRFFFTHDNVGDVGFCESDLEILRQRTFREIICACTNIESLAQSVFHIPSDTNPTVKCSKNDILKPENLCLFGASKKSSELKNPGYVSKSTLSLEKNEVAIIAGGFDGESILNSVEVYSPDGNCNANLPPLPLAIYGVGLFFMNGR